MKARKRYVFSEQSIERKVNNFKLQEVLDRLDGIPPGGHGAEPLRDLLRAGIRPTQRDIHYLRVMRPCFLREYVRRLIAGEDTGTIPVTFVDA